MSLKNRKETKVLLESWRRVLENGLSRNSDIILEEGWKSEFAKKVAPAFLAGAMNITSTVQKAFATPDDVSPAAAQKLSDMSKGEYSPKELKDKKFVKYASAGLILTALQALRKSGSSRGSGKDLDFDAKVRNAKTNIVYDLYYKIFDLSYNSENSFNNEKFNSLMQKIEEMSSKENQAAEFLIKIDASCTTIAKDLLKNSKSIDSVFELAKEAAKQIKSVNFESSFSSSGDRFLKDATQIANFLQSSN